MSRRLKYNKKQLSQALKICGSEKTLTDRINSR